MIPVYSVLVQKGKYENFSYLFYVISIVLYNMGLIDKQERLFSPPICGQAELLYTILLYTLLYL